MHSTERHKVVRLGAGERTEVEDLLAVERRLRVLVDGQELLSLYCSPIMVRELVVGFLSTEGLLQEGFCAERMGIQYGTEEIVVDVPALLPQQKALKAVRTSGCVGGVSFEHYRLQKAPEGPVLRAQALARLYQRFQDSSPLYRLTGCVHSAALSDGKAILCVAEDVGRHNAVDKCIGFALLEGLELRGKVLLSSGRLSSEIAGKCARWGISILASRTAPTSRAIQIAQEAGLTMVGFLRGRRMNIYTHPARVDS
jgi:FdhD protein